MITRQIRGICLLTFFLGVFILGIFIYQDYGISWDERVERLDGIAALNHAIKEFNLNPALLERIHSPLLDHDKNYTGSLDLKEYKDRYYPVGFNLPATLIELLFPHFDIQQIYFLRHLLTFLVSLAGIIALFFLVERRYANWKMGLLACSLFLLSPRFFAESFYNSKDIVLLAFFAIAMNTAIVFIQKPGLKTAFWHALACALTINIRLLALVLPLTTIVFLIAQSQQQKMGYVKPLLAISFYIALTAIFVIIGWPLLWSEPWRHFFEALSFMANYQFGTQMLFLGQTIASTQLPWYYLPVWIGITTPFLYLCLWLLGTTLTLYMLARRKMRLWDSSGELQDLFFLCLFLGPICGVIIFHSVIYDSWRHLYFIYPAFLLIVMRGWTYLWHLFSSHRIIKGLITLIFSSSIIWTSVWMIKAHPLQNTYFNFLAGTNWKNQFDVDYWGLANRQAVQFILAHDQRPIIYLWEGSFNYLFLTLDILSPQDRSRVKIVKNKKEADYILTNYRLNPTNYGVTEPRFKLFYEIKVGNEIIFSVYQAKWIELQKSIVQDQLILFTKNGIGPFFLTEDEWANPESWGVWALGQSSQLKLPIPVPAPKKITLMFNAFVSQNYPKQEILISINGVDSKWQLSKAENNLIELDIPYRLQNNQNSKDIEIVIRPLNPISPKKLGIGDDTRELSVGLVSAYID